MRLSSALAVLLLTGSFFAAQSSWSFTVEQPAPSSNGSNFTSPEKKAESGFKFNVYGNNGQPVNPQLQGDGPTSGFAGDQMPQTNPVPRSFGWTGSPVYAPR